MPVQLPAERTDEDRVVDLEVESFFYHAGPPAAVSVTYRAVLASGARRAAVVKFDEGDAVPETELAKMPADRAATMRQTDTRSDGATRLLAAIMQPDFATRATEFFIAAGKLATRP